MTLSIRSWSFHHYNGHMLIYFDDLADHEQQKVNIFHIQLEQIKTIRRPFKLDVACAMIMS